ncbi:TRM11 family SAM-dependent methyltransferase [Sphaerisporangium aureirubrum]|uniref:TRM11 family SAM-dependent methyltransferase n=1 Tax=Sphaerisporangium aureirubrum TaxID=1544736 RepID=A0ABW1NS11_9ACTN
MTAARLVARCVRGLETVVAAEILQSDGVTVTRLGHREVHFRAGASGWRAASTADDVFLLAGACPDIGPGREGLGALAELAAAVDALGVVRLRERYTGGGALTGVEVSASFLGRRRFNRYDVEDAVGPVLARRLGVGYHSRRSGAVPAATGGGWRLAMDGVRASLMLRVGERPLHRRAYKGITLPGSLHPPVAAAMARLAGVQAGDTVLDPCCGAGTLLIEAYLQQPGSHLYGFDLSPAAVRAARRNAAGAPAADTDRLLIGDGSPPPVGWPGGGVRSAVPISVEQADAGRLPVPGGVADRVLCNPPWGAQVGAGGTLAGDPSAWWRELRRVLAPGGTAVLLLPGGGDIATGIGHGFVPEHVQRIRLSGAQPYIVRFAAPGR